LTLYSLCKCRGQLFAGKQLHQFFSRALPLGELLPMAFQPCAPMQHQFGDSVLTDRREPANFAIRRDLPVQVVISPNFARVYPAKSFRFLFRRGPDICFVQL
jgi:hypothetical protein